MISTAVRRSWLRDAKDAAPLNARSLYEELRAQQTSARTMIAGGEIASTSQAGFSTTFKSSGLQTREIVELLEDLLSLLDLVVADLGNVGDDALFAEMMGRLIPIETVRTDFSYLNYYR